MRSRQLFLIVAIVLGLASLTGCSSLKKEMKSAMANNQEIKLSVAGAEEQVERNAMDWVELDQLSSYKNIRKVWDDKLNIIKFDLGSKNGTIFVDTEGNWAGNNVLYNAFQNKAFVKDYWGDSKLSAELSEAAINEFSDINDLSSGLIASVNAYFNILPGNVDGTSGMMNQLTRAEVMSAVYRADTPVIFESVSEEFVKAVGNSDMNLYAQNITGCSYLKYENGGLNYDTYNSAMTRGEAVYILMNRYFKDEVEAVDMSGVTFTDCKNAGDIASKLKFSEDAHALEAYELEYALQYAEDGCPEDIYKALVVASKRGVISSSTRWNSPILGGELINMIIKTYESMNDESTFVVNAKTGANTGNNMFASELESASINPDSGIEVVVNNTDVKDVTDLDDLFDEYGDEIDLTPDEEEEARLAAAGYTFVPVDKYMQIDYCYFLNVRVGPSTDFRIIKSVEAGTKVHIVAQCVENGWYRVIADKKLAYQCGAYFSDLPESDPDSELNKVKTEEKEVKQSISTDNILDSAESTEESTDETEESADDNAENSKESEE